jgi:hypothetical protein
MQKIQSYLYPNRVILIADLAGFTVENTIVYAKTVKIYKGIDNVIQFDVQNADQKRLDLVNTPLVTNLKMNVMDMSGNALPNSPYTVSNTSITGIGTVTIPHTDLVNINHQYLQYSVTATDTNSNTIPLYTDSRFSAVGKIEVIGYATPTPHATTIYDRFYGEINFMGNVIQHTSATPCKFYEAVPTTSMNFSIHLTNFIGTVYVEATEDMTVSVESFANATQLQSMTYSVATTTTLTFNNVPVANPVTGQNYNYMRVSWTFPDVWQYGSQQNPNLTYGTVDLVTVTH